MTEHDPAAAFERLTPLTTAGDRWIAQLLVARLESEGIPARMTGDSGGPYPVSVGGLATTRVWVPERLIDEAREVLADIDETEITDVEPAGIGVSANPLVSLLWWLVAALLLAWILWARVGRFL